MNRYTLNVDWRVFLAGTAVFASGYLARGLLSSKPTAGVAQSPRKSLLPKLSKEEQLSLPYPPNVFPGARDVETPFGTFRVYEWGPEEGQKVLLVHGITTPSLALGSIALTLAEKGYRVMLFDLAGRGYSDAPTDIQQDVRLFTAQILFVLASSPLSWTAGNGGFSLIGYSLGGGISVALTASLPDMIKSLVLIAPAGLIRQSHHTWTSRILYSEGILPERLLQRVLRSRLQTVVPPKATKSPAKDKDIDATKAVQAETNPEAKTHVALSKAHPDIFIDSAVNHQILNHNGFIPAFMSSMRYGPIWHEHERWRRIGALMTARNEKVLIVLGDTDAAIVHDEIREDASKLLGDHVDFKVVSAGHELPFAKADEVADIILNHWNQTS